MPWSVSVKVLITSFISRSGSGTPLLLLFYTALDYPQCNSSRHPSTLYDWLGFQEWSLWILSVIELVSHVESLFY